MNNSEFINILEKVLSSCSIVKLKNVLMFRHSGYWLFSYNFNYKTLMLHGNTNYNDVQLLFFLYHNLSEEIKEELQKLMFLPIKYITVDISNLDRDRNNLGLFNEEDYKLMETLKKALAKKLNSYSLNYID